MTFHFFHINEVYSNSDGSVQFIEFVGDADAQHIWAGHSITSSNGASTNTYPISTNLPSAATNGKSVLVATQGFANLGIVAPDYIIPNGFLFATNSTISFPGMVGGTLTYTQLPVDGKLSLNRDGSTGINSPTNYAGNTGTVSSNVISGTEGSDNLPGTAGDDVILAAGGQDTLNGGAGNDTLDGGSGTDTAIYSSDHTGYSILATASGLSISGPDGNDTLSGVERIQFADQRLAFDLGIGQAASNTVRVIGAAFDTSTIQEHPDYVGIGLNLFDAGQSVLDVSQLVVGVLSLSNEAFVDTVYQNVFGTVPATADHDLYVGFLTDGSYTQAQLLELAANAEANATNIDLIGLQQTGIAFV
ncbi:MAG: calcium-binding protein [Nitrosomonas sp.]|nr:calcium-binding protein [Nitrosomonas sp.]MBP6076285.1 calcium-binding protein [Nitrosomonas sp.]